MVYIRLSNTQIEELIQHLQGTASTLAQACQQCFDCDKDCLTTEQLEEIDQQIFECDTCGWWFERGEQSDLETGNFCQQCATE